MTERPIRIQRKRVKGWRMPTNTVYVGRPTVWANPFDWRTASKDAGPDEYLRGCAVDMYRNVLLRLEDAGEERFLQFDEYLRRFRLGDANPNFYDDPPDVYDLRAMIVYYLRGRNLACWCPLDQPCHADVLLEVAND